MPMSIFNELLVVILLEPVCVGYHVAWVEEPVNSWSTGSRSLLQSILWRWLHLVIICSRKVRHCEMICLDTRRVPLLKSVYPCPHAFNVREAHLLSINNFALSCPDLSVSNVL